MTLSRFKIAWFQSSLSVSLINWTRALLEKFHVRAYDASRIIKAGFATFRYVRQAIKRSSVLVTLVVRFRP